MILMNLKVDNLLSFKDFEINFSYPRKIVNSSIENEHLFERPNFRYKKVNILMGANASGKTSIGKVLRSIVNFISIGNQKAIEELIRDDNKEAGFEIDFVKDDLFEDVVLYRVVCNIVPKIIDKKRNFIFDVKILSTEVNKKDSYEKCILKLKEMRLENESVSKMLERISIGLNWMFMLTDERESKMKSEEHFDINVLEKVLRTLDIDIVNVRKSKEVENGYIINKKDKSQIIIQEGEIIKNSKLSSGTKAGIEVAELISTIIVNPFSTLYYCDEKFSFIHSTLEKAFLSTMIDLLHPNSQLFFTTHNHEILNMNLPKHSFTFLRKNPLIEAVYPSDFIKKDDRSLYNAVANDIFNCDPSIDEILDLR